MLIRKAAREDADALIRLIQRRLEWMEEQGLDHWNRMDYLEVFPPKYFEENIGAFLVSEEEGRLTGALAVFYDDPVWQDKSPAAYLHHLVADPSCPGTGAALLRFGEQLSRRQGIARVRLDTQLKDFPLGAYYEDKGYRVRGVFRQGPYVGVRREKNLDRENPEYGGTGFFDSDLLEERDLRLVLEKTIPADPEVGQAPAYHFWMQDAQGRQMGRCQLRLGHGEALYYRGHIGYYVDGPWRGQNMAGRACRLLFELAGKHHMGHVIIAADPANTASCRAAAWAGCEYLETLDVPGKIMGPAGPKTVSIFVKNLGRD